jgi:NodT family efflux transporter outer membrane factor (OMF) lipoprotein
MHSTLPPSQQAAGSRSRTRQRVTVLSLVALATAGLGGCAALQEGLREARAGMGDGGSGLPPRSSPDVSAVPSEVAATAPEQFRDRPPPPAGDAARWWQVFADPVLDSLVREALDTSLTVQQAQLRVVEARNRGRNSVAGFAPSLTASAGTDTDVAIGGPDLQGSGGQQETTQTTGNGGLRASWELPLWGRLGAARAGAEANVMQAQFDLEASKIALIGDIASTYVNLRTAQVRVAYIEEDIERAERLERIAADRLRVGLISRSEAAFARSQLAGLQAQLPDARLAVTSAYDALAILRGAMPGTLDARLAPPADIISYRLADQVPQVTAIPADLLRRRPDVLRAEQNVLLQSAAVGIARSEMYPSITIGGTISLLGSLTGNPLPEMLTRGGATTGISLPLFDFGRRRANLAATDAVFQQTLLAYQQTALNAVREGQAALAQYSQGRERTRAALAAEEAAADRYRANEAAFRAGLTSLKELTEAQTDLASARQQRLTAQLQVSDASVGLYRTFAGSPGI